MFNPFPALLPADEELPSAPPLVGAFRGVHYRLSQDLAPLLAPPYDIVGRELQQKLHQRHPHNCIRLELANQPDRYARSATTFDGWLEEGVLVQDGSPALYACAQGFDLSDEWRVRRGVFCLVRLEAQPVLRHEATMAGPKADRLELLRACQAQFSPVLALATPETRLKSWLDQACQGEPLAAGGREHLLWKVDQRDLIDGLKDSLAGRPLFIADGHHRYETALAFQREMRERFPDASPRAAFNYVLILVIPIDDPGLAVLATHRLIRGLSDRERKQVEQRIDRWFEREPVALESRRSLWRELEESTDHRMAVVASGRLWRLRPRQRLEDAVPVGPAGMLEVEALHRLVLDRAINDAGREAVGRDLDLSSGRIRYLSDPEEVLAQAKKGEYGFLLSPTRVEQVLAMAQAGLNMPEKSTYFYPKAPAGLMMAKLGPQEQVF